MAALTLHRRAACSSQAEMLCVTKDAVNPLTYTMQETYTIIQRNEHDIWGVIGISYNLKYACERAADYCNMNGVARTLVLNSMGQTVCVES